MSGACRLLDWDSAFFGVRVARCDATRLTPELVGEVREFCREQAVDCLYLLADAGCADTVRLAEAGGFHLVDLRVTLERRLKAGEGLRTPDGIRAARPDDVASLRAIASSSHTDSRFYFDGRFARERCDELYATWIERSCAGWADAVLVAEAAGGPAGYITCHQRPEEGQIGLIAVAPAAQGSGLGGRLVAAALAWFAGRGLALASVVTQGRNSGAQRLYQRAGFVTRSIQLSYHLWPAEVAAP